MVLCRNCHGDVHHELSEKEKKKKAKRKKKVKPIILVYLNNLSLNFEKRKNKI